MRLIALALVLVLPAGLRAQRVVTTLDLNGSSMRYADSLSATGVSVSPAVSVESARATVDAAGTLSELAGSWTTQGTVGASLYTSKAGIFVGELTGSAGGSAHQDATRTSQLLALARAHVMGTQSGFWIGAGGGRTWDGSVGRTVREAEGGAWTQLGSLNAVASATPTVVDDTIKYTDGQLSLRLQRSRIELGLSAGARWGKDFSAARGSATSWGSGSITAWLTQWAALVASAGSYPVDLTQGYPGGRFVTIGVRLGRRTSAAATQVSSPQPVATIVEPDPTAAGGITGFATTAGPGGRRTIRIQAPGARRVEIAADFTNWDPVRLTPAADGWWAVSLPVTSGTHEVNARLEGGPWLVPPGLTRSADEFGGAVGILVVQ